MLTPALLALLGDRAPVLEHVVSVEDCGAVPDDGLDDAVAFRACLAQAIAEADGWLTDARPVLEVPPGDWDLVAQDTGPARYSMLHVDAPATIRGAGRRLSRLILGAGELAGTARDGLVVDGAVGVIVEDLALAHIPPHGANEQAHALVVSGEADAWSRAVVLRRLDIGPSTSGDCIYLGSHSERIHVEDVWCHDAARGGVVIAGGSGDQVTRDGFVVRGLRHWHTGVNPDQQTGPVVDVEPSSAASQVASVLLEDVVSVTGQLHLGGRDIRVRGAHAAGIKAGQVEGLVVRDSVLFGSEGTGGDGAGYTVALFRPPHQVRLIDSVLRVPPGGAGALYVRDYSATEEPWLLRTDVDATRSTVLLTDPEQQCVRQDLISDWRVRADCGLEGP